MKKRTGQSVKLGMFVTIAVLLFISGIYFIGQRQRLFSNVFRLRGIFGTVSGLQVGNNVRFAGINVGTVENIRIVSDTEVCVNMIIDNDTKKFIKKDAHAIIGSEGLMGNKVVNITPGTESDEEVENNDYIETDQPVNIDSVLSQLKATAENASRITGNLADITDRIKSGKGTIGKLLMDSSFAGNVDQALVNIKQGSKGFQENMDAAKHSFLLRGIFRKRSKKNDQKEAVSKK